MIRGVVVPLVNVAVLAGAFVHNRGFWKAKAEVPFVEGINEGIRRSKRCKGFDGYSGYRVGGYGIV